MSFWDSGIFEEAESNASYEAIPAGKYEAVLVNAATKQTKNGMGYYLNCELEITGPSRAGAKVFHKINVHHATSRQAVSIGMGQLHSLAVAGGADAWWERCKQASSLEGALAHLNTLHTAIAGKRFGANVTVKSDEKYGDQNEVKSFVKLADGGGTQADDLDIPF